MRVGRDGVLEKQRQLEQDKIETSSQIWKRLKREPNGEASLNEDLIATFESLRMEGCTRNNAAKIVGLSEKKMQAWLKKGAADVEVGTVSLFADFTWMVHRCEGEQQRVLARAAFGIAVRPTSDGTLAVKILERRVPEEWAPALPELPDAAAGYVGLAGAALRAEAQRVLKTVAKDAEIVEPVPAKLEPGNG